MSNTTKNPNQKFREGVNLKERVVRDELCASKWIRYVD